MNLKGSSHTPNAHDVTTGLRSLCTGNSELPRPGHVGRYGTDFRFRGHELRAFADTLSHFLPQVTAPNLQKQNIPRPVLLANSR